MKIAVIGSGGREHALAWKLAQSSGWDNVFTLPGNAGIKNSHPVNVNDFEGIKSFCKNKGIETVFTGPEQPLAEGIVNYFKGSGIRVLGPDKVAAQLEGSKIFAKQFMDKYDISTAAFHIFNKPEEALETIAEKDGDLVIKYDGLAAGKGVYVCSSQEEAKDALEDLRRIYGDTFPFIIEDKIAGDEISIIGFTDGKCIKLLLPSEDHKQLLDGDKGPNTGGMGAVCPVSFWNEELLAVTHKTIVDPTLRGIQSEGMDYKGVIYFGLMIDDKGPKLLEYNVRFGDPETEVLLPPLKTDLAEIVQACLDGTLEEVDFEFEKGFFVDVVQVSGGYPKAYAKGHPISGLDKVDEDTIVFHAGTKMEDGKLVTNGGRVLNIVCKGDTLEEAIQEAYEQCSLISFKDHFYRKDIGRREYKFVSRS